MLLRNCSFLHSALHANTLQLKSQEYEEEDVLLPHHHPVNPQSSSVGLLFFCYFYRSIGRSLILLLLLLSERVSIDSITRERRRDGQVNQYGMRIIVVVLNRKELILPTNKCVVRWSLFVPLRLTTVLFILTTWSIDGLNRYRKYNWRFLAAARDAELLINAFRNLLLGALWENHFPRVKTKSTHSVEHVIMQNSSPSSAHEYHSNDTGREIILSMQIVYVSIITVVSTANRELACNSGYRKFNS